MRRAGFISFILLLASSGTMAQESKEKEKDDPAKVSPVLLRGPYLQSATSRSMMIRWRTDALSRSRVEYGLSPDSLTLFVNDSNLVNEHQITIRGLQPLTKYYYSIGAIKEVLQRDSNNYFYTLPARGQSGTFRVAAFGDCGNNSVNQYEVRDKVLQYLGNQYLNAWILLGDNTYPDGTDAEFQVNFFNVYKDQLLKKYPLFPSPGNHDYHDKEFSAAAAQKTHEIAYYQDFTMPANGESGGIASHTPSYYSFDIGTAHFLSLDSYGKMDDQRMYDTLGPQVTWIKRDLAEATTSKWIIVYFHHPPFTKGSHDGDTENELVKIRENFIRILERYGVDLVLCGHSHDYERSRLMQGFYGRSEAFDAAKYLVSKSSGKTDGSPRSEAYHKTSDHGRGTVYVVSGSAGKLGGQQTGFPHKAMFYSDADHGGADLLEFKTKRLISAVEPKWNDHTHVKNQRSLEVR